MDVPLTWLLQQLTPELKMAFKIDRLADACHTPRRNDDVAAACEFFGLWERWANSAARQLLTTAGSVVQRHGNRINAQNHGHKSLSADGIFVPIMPLMETTEDGGGARLLATADIAAFLQEQKRSLDAKVAQLMEEFPATATEPHAELLSAPEAILVCVLRHSSEISQAYLDGVLISAGGASPLTCCARPEPARSCPSSGRDGSEPVKKLAGPSRTMCSYSDERD